MLYFGHMTNNLGYQINEQDIKTTINYLKTQNKPYSKEDAIKYLKNSQAIANIVAQKIVEDEQNGIIDPVNLENN